MTVSKIVTLKDLKKIKNNGGMTIKNYRIITYKTGWQVATEGIEVTSIQEVMHAIKSYNGNVGLWFYNGVWYVDHSQRVNTKKEAMLIGRNCNQQTVLKWSTMDCVEVK